MDLQEQSHLVRSRKDLATFVLALRNDLHENRGHWQNTTLETFLSAMEAWIVDMEGYSVEETAQAVETLAGLLSDGAMTVLLVEHDMEVVFRLARMITVLHRGAVIADGSPDAVKADAEVQRAYLGGLG